MNVLDSTIVNVSLTHIAGDFAVAPTQGTWVITSYAVSVFLSPTIELIDKSLSYLSTVTTPFALDRKSTRLNSSH